MPLTVQSPVILALCVDAPASDLMEGRNDMAKRIRPDAMCGSWAQTQLNLHAGRSTATPSDTRLALLGFAQPPAEFPVSASAVELRVAMRLGDFRSFWGAAE